MEQQLVCTLGKLTVDVNLIPAAGGRFGLGAVCGGFGLGSVCILKC